MDQVGSSARLTRIAGSSGSLSLCTLETPGQPEQPQPPAPLVEHPQTPVQEQPRVQRRSIALAVSFLLASLRDLAQGVGLPPPRFGTLAPGVDH